MTHRTDIAHGWLETVDAAGWMARVANAARTTLKAIDTGLKAAHDYQSLATQVSPQQATRMVFEKHFSD